MNTKVLKALTQLMPMPNEIPDLLYQAGLISVEKFCKFSYIRHPQFLPSSITKVTPEQKATAKRELATVAQYGMWWYLPDNQPEAIYGHMQLDGSLTFYDEQRREIAKGRQLYQAANTSTFLPHPLQTSPENPWLGLCVHKLWFGYRTTRG